MCQAAHKIAKKKRDLDALFRATKGTVKAEAATIMLSLKQSRVPKKVEGHIQDFFCR